GRLPRWPMRRGSSNATSASRPRAEEERMAVTLKELRPVHVVGIGLHRYQFLSNTSYIDLGLTAVRGALADAGLEFPAIESAYVGRALLPMACGRPILRHLGATGLPIVHVENASASGSTAFRHAVI